MGRCDREGFCRSQNGNPKIIRELELLSEPELLTDVLAQPDMTSRPSKRLNANRERMQSSSIAPERHSARAATANRDDGANGSSLGLFAHGPAGSIP